MSRVRQAVILAAGMGTRLRDQWQDLPKGFLCLGEKPIVEESIGKLIRSGIDEIIIVTGYRRDRFQELVRRWPFVKTVANDEYETTGSMKSLSKAKDFVKDDFLLLEADLVYEFNALQILQNTDCKNCVLLSGETHSGDEVYADVRNNRVVKFSKNKADIAHIGGELVGISRISLGLYKEMIAREVGTTGKYDYENCLSDISHVEKIEFEFVEDLAWCEIDDAKHLERAKNDVYQTVRERDLHLSLHRKTDRGVLLNPGPATTTDSVKYAMVTEDICPREVEFGEMVEGIRKDLVRVVHGEGQYEAVLFGSSGTGAVESCLTSVIPPGKSVLIINNGAYGERMEKICEAFGIPHVDYDIEWGQPIDLEVLHSRLYE
ncbi:MAG: NTP transferase domain-containing protein, partial [Ignavibacteriales bacterium]|nr:NTP transferase domain-containing protein [Ignavibacteriales bacterium]